MRREAGATALPPGWLARAQSGDSTAFRAVFDLYAAPVRRFLEDLLRDRHAADEATQETFVRAHRRLPSLREAEKVAGWLFGIARLVAFEQRRWSEAQTSWSSEEADEEPGSAVAHLLPGPTPESLLLDRELEGLMGDAIAQLSAPRRAALLLRIDHDLGYDDIAAAMGWTLPKVKNEIHRARLQLRALLVGHTHRAAGPESDGGEP